MAKKEKVYLAGPMSGIKNHNRRSFLVAEKLLRREGYEVVNPVRLDDVSKCDSWAAYLKRDIPHLLKCKTIALLSGWENSKGANLERHIAKELGLTVYYI